ncbi:PD-(D/E)XK nuclease-like domain-containing protein [Kineothrix sp. MB12-C1]|uniref:PD-(D/E)XK nuclease-like domain-containing protein n=1 Tax=Kineothrix sp. MB12-C1 TaxID=3070215 RepID=UPI0027D25D1D|nr:PD-(D/E)XK nuclease-like domain-containing protein [Kineothrix sp. MB12-C1]WMC91227.1 PD-(D/E)XK nuclease-like domain-containing protein [Kineothrix sp. MB12-C1]
MKLTAENYFSKEADREYLSVSQYKRFVGCLGRVGCEAKAMAELSNEWMDGKSTALMVGSYVDAHFEGTLDLFRAQNPDIFTQKGTLKAEYRRAEEVINRIERDEYFMAHMAGEKQIIMSGELFGAKWKIKMDSYFPDTLIVDLKTMKSLGERFYSADFGYMDFIRNWGYDIQGAIYQKVVEINTGKKLPFKIAAVSKEEFPDIDIIQVEQSLMDAALSEVEKNVPSILAVKEGEYAPVRCERRDCNYCKHTKVLTHSIWSDELMVNI